MERPSDLPECGISDHSAAPSLALVSMAECRAALFTHVDSVLNAQGRGMDLIGLPAATPLRNDRSGSPPVTRPLCRLRRAFGGPPSSTCWPAAPSARRRPCGYALLRPGDGNEAAGKRLLGELQQ